MVWVFPPQSVKLCVYAFWVFVMFFFRRVRRLFGTRNIWFWFCVHTIFWYVKHLFSILRLVITPPCTVTSASAQIPHVWYFLYSPLRLQDFWRVGLVLTPSDSVRCFWEPNYRKWRRLIHFLIIFFFFFSNFPCLPFLFLPNIWRIVKSIRRTCYGSKNTRAFFFKMETAQPD